MDVTYHLTGSFIESCDCSVICPCWVDETPDEDHCTGLVAWTLSGESRIDATGVGGLKVVSVSSHDGSRRGSEPTSVLFVDDRATPEQFRLLVAAFSGDVPGPMGDLAGVTGEVLLAQQARIDIGPAGPSRSDPPDDAESFEVSVRASGGTDEDGRFVHAIGSPSRFDGNVRPMTLADTALHLELGVGREAVTAQQASAVTVAVPALPAGYVDVTSSSGMRGSFSYRLVALPDPPRPRIARP